MLAHSPRSPIPPFLPIGNLARILGPLLSGVFRVLARFYCVSAVIEEAVNVPSPLSWHHCPDLRGHRDQLGDLQGR